jgi:hypothetical protein
LQIIDSEDFLDELSSVRAAYKRAFKELILEAIAALKVRLSLLINGLAAGFKQQDNV